MKRLEGAHSKTTASSAEVVAASPEEDKLSRPVKGRPKQVRAVRKGTDPAFFESRSAQEEKSTSRTRQVSQ